MKASRIFLTIILIEMLLTACAPKPSTPGIHGRITDRHGKPLDGILLTIGRGPFPRVDFRFTDASGNYDFGDQPTGQYTLHIQWSTSDLVCPSLQQGIPMTKVQGFLVAYANQGSDREVLAVQSFDFNAGDSAGYDLKIPCTGTPPE